MMMSALALVGASMVACVVQLAGAEPPAHETIPEGEPFPAHIAPGVLLPRTPESVVQGPFVSVQVNTTPDGMDIVGDAANEPSIAIDPTNPSNIAIGWRQFDTIASSFREAGYSYSRDSGKTWAGGLEHTPGVFRSDPVLRAGPDGELYYLSLQVMPSLFCELFVSNDFGETWAPPLGARGGDKAWMAVDLTDSPTRGAIYQHWTSSFSRSFDGGLTWSAPLHGVPAFGQIALSPSGEVFVAGVGPTLTRVVQILDADDPDADPEIIETGVTGIPIARAGQSVVNPEGLLGHTNIAFDRSGGVYGGRMYIMMSASAVFPDDPTDTVVVSSDDGGVTFSQVTRINDEDNAAIQWFGTLSLAPNGRLDAVWNDQRDSDQATPFRFTRLYASYSTDGGQTWAPNFPVSPSFNRTLGYPIQRKLGDYYDAHSDNLGMNLAYAATFNGGQDVYFLRIGETDCNDDGVPDQMQTAAGLAPDCDGDGLLDACQARAGEAPPCYCPSDLAPPFGVLDFDDVLAFLVAFAEESMDADLAPPLGELDFDDVIEFLTSFGAGCP